MIVSDLTLAEETRHSTRRQRGAAEIRGLGAFGKYVLCSEKEGERLLEGVFWGGKGGIVFFCFFVGSGLLSPKLLRECDSLLTPGAILQVEKQS